MHALLAIGGCESEPKSHSTHLDVCDVHHLEFGEGPPVLLLHGAGGGAANWYKLIPRLTRAGYRVIAPDLPGFGLTDAIDPETPLGLQTARIVSQWMTTIGLEQATVIGTSFGGLAALLLARHFPHRVQRLILVDAAGAGPDIPNIVLSANMTIAPWVYFPTRGGTRRMLRRWLVSRPMPKQEETALVEYLYRSARRMGGRYMIRALRMFMKFDGRRVEQAEQPSSEELSRIETETLIVWGEQDRFFPVSHATALAMRMPHARKVIIEGAGHSPNWDTPDELAAAILEFMKD